MATRPPVDWPAWTAPVQHASAVSVTERSRRGIDVRIGGASGDSTHLLAWHKDGRRTEAGDLWWNFTLDDQPCCRVRTRRGEPLVLFDLAGRGIGGVDLDLGPVRDTVRVHGPGYLLKARSGLAAAVLDEWAVGTRWKVAGQGVGGFNLWTTDVFTFRARARGIDERIDWRLVAVMSVVADHGNRL